MTAYNFHQQLAIGASGERFLDRFFESAYEITPATDAEQRSGIDRHFRNRSSGKLIKVEYKTDWRAADTHNAFIETVSVDTRQRSGWAYTSAADWLCYYVPGDELIYVIHFERLREFLPGWSLDCRHSSADNGSYKTHGLLVPLEELERIAAIVYSA